MSRKKREFTTADASERLMDSMSVAIDNMIEEIRKPVDPEINGVLVRQNCSQLNKLQ